MVVSLLFYMALDGQGQLEPEVRNGRLDAILGSSEELGDFRLSFPKQQTKARVKSHYLASYAENLSQLKDVLFRGARMYRWQEGTGLSYIGLGGRAMAKDSQGDPNFVVHQVTVKLPFEMEILFESGSFADRPNSLSGGIFQNELNRHKENFNKRFEDKFGLSKKGFQSSDVVIAQSIMANMVGGIGYFYGQSLVKSPNNQEPVTYWSAPLYTGVPSRSFFPRGFLWDEGFHNLLISKWDPVISMDIIGHWLDLMNSDGWIPREQILGPEARAKVPSEFVVQKSENANPPTLFLPLQRLVKQLIKSEDPKDRRYLEHLYPRLKVWYNWFNTSQNGPVPFTYRWKGRDAKTKRELNPKTLSSGLDDGPRASHPSEDERHLDLRCWMAIASGVMSDIAKTIGKPWQEYEATYKTLTDNDILDNLHWSSQGQQYSDYGLHSDKVKLVRPKPPKSLHPGQRPPADIQLEMERVTKKAPELKFVDSYGYISLFPFLLKIVDPYSLKLGKILQDLQNPSLLWSRYGLRSLAKSAPLYNKYNTEHDPPYWRGAIWININFLALDALHHYANTPGSYKDIAAGIYTDLRKNLISNILSQYRRTGYIWENYDDNTGQGKGCHPFTGWSALVVLMMAEEF